MSNLNVSLMNAKSVSPNYSSKNAEQETINNKNTNVSADDGSKLNKALKCLGFAAAAGLALYSGNKAIKYLKNVKAKSVTTLPALVNKKPVITNVGKATNKVSATFSGYTSTQIAEMYKAGDKTIYRNLAKVSHPDKGGSQELLNLFNEVKAAIA